MLNFIHDKILQLIDYFDESFFDFDLDFDDDEIQENYMNATIFLGGLVVGYFIGLALFHLWVGAFYDKKYPKK